jgi:hypothetical protein
VGECLDGELPNQLEPNDEAVVCMLVEDAPERVGIVVN